MRLLRLLLVACLLAPSVGCAWARDALGMGPRPQPHAGGAVPNVAPEQLVDYLNTQAARLQALSFGEVAVSAKEGDGLVGAIKEQVYPTLRGNLSASQPRQFRMVATGGLVDAKVDFGSNPQQFWAYVSVPKTQPMYVFASHTDFEQGKAKLPGNMPFDPDWVMQALGMTRFPEGVPYEVKTDDRARSYTLSWPSTTPNGLPVRKEVVFAADEADPRHNQPQVRKHLVRDAKTNRVIAHAEVKSAQTVPVGGTDPATGRSQNIQYPTHIVLRWEEQKFEMTLKLGGAKVNPQLTPEDLRRLYDLPNKEIPPVDLAHARYDRPGE